MAADLITLAAYKEYVGIKNPDKDGKISLLIKLTSQLVKSYCARTFIDHITVAKTEQFDARQSEIVLSEFPVISVTTVKTSVDGGITQITLTENDADASGYFVDLENSKVFSQLENINFLAEVNHPYKSLEIEYLAGFTLNGAGVTAEVPLDIRLAMFDLVAYYQNNEKSLDKQMATSSITNPSAPRMSNDFPSHIKRVLDLYRVLDI